MGPSRTTPSQSASEASRSPTPPVKWIPSRTSKCFTSAMGPTTSLGDTASSKPAIKPSTSSLPIPVWTSRISRRPHGGDAATAGPSCCEQRRRDESSCAAAGFQYPKRERGQCGYGHDSDEPGHEPAKSWAVRRVRRERPAHDHLRSGVEPGRSRQGVDKVLTNAALWNAVDAASNTPTHADTVLADLKQQLHDAFDHAGATGTVDELAALLPWTHHE